ncbi:hypothetical protein WJX84_002487 [Apatococcus fuscideae]|uniref:Uncharacterized protein n=1 Tax=Apatococcus fuscideae TaxID=2026836 RepID=A0AAW1THV3_9CHLO
MTLVVVAGVPGPDICYGDGNQQEAHSPKQSSAQFQPSAKHVAPRDDRCTSPKPPKKGKTHFFKPRGPAFGEPLKSFLPQ